MVCREREVVRTVHLPTPSETAFFPEYNKDPVLDRIRDIVLTKTGKDNLVCAFLYGSKAFGGATKNSRFDMLIVVDDTLKFHERNYLLYPRDYSQMRLPSWHNFLNRFGFNFMQMDKKGLHLKYAVISKSDFIKGCKGSLVENEQAGVGKFGLYASGRVQKAALLPLYTREKDFPDIQRAINSARIDGVWLALGLMPDKFSFEELALTYIGLSYKADARIERPDKIISIFEKGKDEYRKMLSPIIADLINAGYIRFNSKDDSYEVLKSMLWSEVEKRLFRLKFYTMLINYIKNPLTVGIHKGIIYAIQKVIRAARRA